MRDCFLSWNMTDGASAKSQTLWGEKEKTERGAVSSDEGPRDIFRFFGKIHKIIPCNYSKKTNGRQYLF